MKSTMLAFTLTLCTFGSAFAQKDLVDTAVAAGAFKTLVTAVTAAELVDTLKNGTFTVFAPTDAAFAGLPEGVVAELLKPKNRGQLTGLLTFHVVAGRIDAAELRARGSLATLNGQRVDIAVEGTTVTVNGAQVRGTAECSNGIIHIVDRVLVPEEASLVGIAKSAGSFTTLLAAAKAAGLVGVLDGKGPLTIFAPTDEAFAKLPDGTVANLLRKENRAELVRILQYHVVGGRFYAGDLLTNGAVKTLQGDPVRTTLEKGRLFVNGAAVLGNDIDASNGVVHIVDAVLLPPAKKPSGRLIVGIFTEKPETTIASYLGINPAETLAVARVSKGGPAEQAGIIARDIIVAIDGAAATSETLAQAKERAGAGGILKFNVLRRGRELTVDIKVGVEAH